MPRNYSIPELRRAHRELAGHFVPPGKEMPAAFIDAMRDPLWSRLVCAKAASNLYHARQRARGAHLHLHHNQGDTCHDQ